MGHGSSTRRRRARAATAGLATLAFAAGAAWSSTAYLDRPEVRAFIGDLNTGHGLEVAELERVLGEAKHQASVVRLIGPERVRETLDTARGHHEWATLLQ